jgi:flagellar biosynthetic protein FlhB
MLISSAELIYGVEFALGVFLLGTWGVWWWSRMAHASAGWIESAFFVDRAAISILPGAIGRFFHIAAPLAAVLLLIVTVGVLTQFVATGFGWAPAKLAPDLSRLNPAQRLTQLPAQNLYQLGRAVLLLPAVAVLLAWFISTIWADILTLPMKGFLPAVSEIALWAQWLLGRAAALLFCLGVLDWVRQRSRYYKQLRMSKQEVREEIKETEGNTSVKARIRRMQREVARRRSVSQVPSASVVVVNPTHFAIAIRYVQAEMAAPKVIAKGRDALAARIRKIAGEHGIPIVENPPLAQALYKSAEVGAEIPPAFYRAVAEVLAYIYRVTQGRLRYGPA